MTTKYYCFGYTLTNIILSKDYNNREKFIQPKFMKCYILIHIYIYGECIGRFALYTSNGTSKYRVLVKYSPSQALENFNDLYLWDSFYFISYRDQPKYDAGKCINISKIEPFSCDWILYAITFNTLLQYCKTGNIRVQEIFGNLCGFINFSCCKFVQHYNIFHCIFNFFQNLSDFDKQGLIL